MDTQTLGARIREARKKAGLSQEDLASQVAKDQAAISEYESGERRISAVDLPLFAQALDVPLLYFYQGEISPDDLDVSILAEFHRLPTFEAKHAAITILRVLSNTIEPFIR